MFFSFSHYLFIKWVYNVYTLLNKQNYKYKNIAIKKLHVYTIGNQVLRTFCKTTEKLIKCIEVDPELFLKICHNKVKTSANYFNFSIMVFL